MGLQATAEARKSKVPHGVHATLHPLLTVCMSVTCAQLQSLGTPSTEPSETPAPGTDDQLPCSNLHKISLQPLKINNTLHFSHFNKDTKSASGKEAKKQHP